MQMTDEDYKINYNKGLSLFETRNFYDAIPYFMISKDSKEYRKQSLNYLVLIKIYTTNYKEARKILLNIKMNYTLTIQQLILFLKK